NLSQSLQDYKHSVIPPQVIGDRGENILVINPGSAYVRMGLAQQHTPCYVPQCIARYMSGGNKRTKSNLQDQMLNSPITPVQQLEREKAYDIIASLLKIPFLDEEVANNSFARKQEFMQTIHMDGKNPQSGKSDSAFTWTNVMEKKHNPSAEIGSENIGVKDESLNHAEGSENIGVKDELLDHAEGVDGREPDSSAYKYRKFICGEEAQRVSPTEPYCLRRPIRRGHLNVSQHYPSQQVVEAFVVVSRPSKYFDLVELQPTLPWKNVVLQQSKVADGENCFVLKLLLFQ
ncbi:hypothetical protein GIB67_036571, partial [Kingdonia uniflora]